MLVDPLAALFRPDLAGEPPLRLELTRVEVELLAPLARVAVTRTFFNNSDRAIEAVLTLPPAQPDEVTYGLTVTIDGVPFRAAAEARRAAGQAHDLATAEGRLSILHERLANDVQLVSIAGVGPMAMVEVRIESVRALDRGAPGLAALSIPLTADPRRLNRGLQDVERLLTTEHKHPATLTVVAGPMNVTLVGGDGVLVSGRAVMIDCAAPVALAISAQAAGGLDQTAQDVGEAGGWEAAIEAPLETMIGGLEPINDPSEGLEGRGDWIAGRATAGGASIRVVAPSPLASAGEASPNTRAMAAFAASYLVDSASPVAPAKLRRAAGVLDRTTSLSFVDANGAPLGEMPRLRKVALSGASAKPVAPPVMAQPPAGEPEPDPMADLQIRFDGIVPGPTRAQGRRRDGRTLLRGLLEAAPWVLIIVWLLGATVALDSVPLRVVFGGLLIALLLNAWLNFPRGDNALAAQARRRLPWLLTLALPLTASWIGGPFGLMVRNLDPTGRSGAMLFQAGCLAVAGALALGLLFAMRGARRFTINAGVLAFILTFLAVSLAAVTLSPGEM